MNRLLIKIAALLCGVIFAGQSVQAAPWAEVGGRQLKQDLEILKASGLINVPLTTWPLPWHDIAASLDENDTPALPAYVKAARARVLARMDDSLRDGMQVEARAAVATDPKLVRDFESAARSNVDAGVRVTQQDDKLVITSGIGWRDNPDGKNFHLDTLSASLAVGNWILYGGTVEQWWGPANESALLFSNSTRPFPKIGVKRNSAQPFSFAPLRWLGPWSFDAFVGQLREKREFSNQMVAGMRLSFEPARNLEVGVQRALQLCGKGRPCGAKTWANALVGIANADNTGTANEPGNQIAGFDLRYSGRVGNMLGALYFETIAEDEDNILIEQFSQTFGASLIGGLESGASWRVGAEYSDTLASKFFGGRDYPGSSYNQFIYTDGFTYKKRPIGASLDSDSKLLSLTASLTDTLNRRFYGTYRHAQINVTNLPHTNRVSTNRESIHILEGGVNIPTSFGDLTLEGRMMSDRANTPLSRKGQTQAEMRWVSHF